MRSAFQRRAAYLVNLLRLRSGRLYACANINVDVIGGICHVSVHCSRCGVDLGVNGTGITRGGFYVESWSGRSIETRRGWRDHVKFPTVDHWQII